MYYKVEQDGAAYIVCIYDGANIDLLTEKWRPRYREFPLFTDWLAFHGHGEIVEPVETRRIEL